MSERTIGILIGHHTVADITNVLRDVTPGIGDIRTNLFHTASGQSETTLAYRSVGLDGVRHLLMSVYPESEGFRQVYDGARTILSLNQSEGAVKIMERFAAHYGGYVIPRDSVMEDAYFIESSYGVDLDGLSQLKADLARIVGPTIGAELSQIVNNPAVVELMTQAFDTYRDRLSMNSSPRP